MRFASVREAGRRERRRGRSSWRGRGCCEGGFVYIKGRFDFGGASVACVVSKGSFFGMSWIFFTVGLMV